jgi:hypothetical protein
MNATIQKGLKVTVIGGSAIIALGSVHQMYKHKWKLKESAFPIITLIVAVSAFSYAMSGAEITLVPSTAKSAVTTNTPATDEV